MWTVYVTFLKFLSFVYVILKLSILPNHVEYPKELASWCTLPLFIFLQQKSWVRFTNRSDTINMKVIIYPTEEIFEDLFLQDLEFLLLKENTISTKSLNEDKTIAKVMNTLVKPTKSAEDTKALLVDISR